MNWKEKITAVENLFGDHKDHNWMPKIEVILNLLTDNPNDVELNVRSTYILHNIIVEEDYPIVIHDFIADTLKECYQESYKKFSGNSEYLFFIGKILYIAEWYFGIDEADLSLEEKKAFQMQKRSSEMEPNNILFKWALVFSQNRKSEAYDLSKQILFEECRWLDWLNKKGFPGKYMLESLKFCYNTYQNENIK